MNVNWNKNIMMEGIRQCRNCVASGLVPILYSTLLTYNSRKKMYKCVILSLTFLFCAQSDEQSPRPCAFPLQQQRAHVVHGTRYPPWLTESGVTHGGQRDQRVSEDHQRDRHHEGKH